MGRSPDTAHPLSPTVGPTGDTLYSCRQSEENLTGEQGGPDVVPPYAAYAPPGTPQVGLEHPLRTAVAQLPLAPTPASPILAQGRLRKSVSIGAQGPHSQNSLTYTPHCYSFHPSLSHSINANGLCPRPGLIQGAWTQRDPGVTLSWGSLQALSEVGKQSKPFILPPGLPSPFFILHSVFPGPGSKDHLLLGLGPPCLCQPGLRR